MFEGYQSLALRIITVVRHSEFQ